MDSKQQCSDKDMKLSHHHHMHLLQPDGGASNIEYITELRLRKLQNKVDHLQLQVVRLARVISCSSLVRLPFSDGSVWLHMALHSHGC